MGARFNRQDVVLGALPVGTPVPEDVIDEIVASEGLPNEPFDWDVLPPGTAGQVLTVNADTSIGWATPTHGTVTSVSWTGDGTIFTASADTAVTTSGTLTPASLIAQTKNTFLGGPTTGSNVAPTFRALTQADISGLSPISSPGTGTSSQQFGAGASTGTSTSSTAIGNGATVGGNQAVAIGNGATVGAGANQSVCIGQGTSCVTTQTVMIGSGATCAGSGVAIGQGANIGTSCWNSIALGIGATVTVANQFAVGGANNQIVRTDINGSSAGTVLNLNSLSSGTPTERHCGIISSSFNTSADATWSGNLSLYAGDYTSSNAGKRLGVQIQSDGTQALLGLFGATPVVQPVGGGGDVTNFVAGSGTAVTSASTWTGATGSSTYTIGDIVTALKKLGALAP
ncbi:MAG: hypothetical protein ACXWPK_00265 [Isosphaeraceae bacterium]